MGNWFQQLFQGLGAPPDRQEVPAPPPQEQPARNFLQEMSDYFSPLLQGSMSQARESANNPFLVLPNRGFFGNHPRISGAIENALIGAATTQSGDTVGENISNVARSVLGLPDAKQAIRTQRAMAPLQFAQPLMQLMQMQQKMADSRDERIYKQGLLQYYSQLGAKAGQPDFERPYGADGKLWTMDPRTGTPKPLIDPASGQQLPDPKTSGVLGLLGGGRGDADERAVAGEMLAAWMQDGGPEPGSPEWLVAFSQRTQSRKVARASAAAGGSAAASTRARIGEGVETPDALQGRISNWQGSINNRLTALRRKQASFADELLMPERFRDPQFRGYQPEASAREIELLEQALPLISDFVRQNPDATYQQFLEAISGGGQAPPPPAPKKGAAAKTKKPMASAEDYLSKFK